nr:insulinase family protein [Echinimonas agarilytica]
MISDPQSEQGAAAMAVNVGQFDDPTERPGMAHFLEHMLFLGTENFPKAGEYAAYIQRNGGNHNAWTGTEHTCFFFDVQAPAFGEGLQRFSQFFVCPLFNHDCIDKERNAIESEFQMKVNDDTRRIYQAHKETVNPEHPFSRFSVGNLQTLNDSENTLRDEVMSFYQQQYDAKRMTLCVLAPMDLDDLQEGIEFLFSSIKTGTNIERLTLPELYLPEHLQINIDVKPLKSMRRAMISFPLPPQAQNYLTKPVALMSHLLGYEGQRSLFAGLKDQGLINTLTAGGGIKGSNYHDFNVSLNFTELGWKHQNKVIEALFGYQKLIRQQGIEEWRYLEKQRLYQQAFEFSQPSSALDTVSHLVMNMQKYAAEDYIFGDYAMTEFNGDQIIDLSQRLTPDSMRVTRVHQDVKTDQVSSWYNTPYRVSQIDSSNLNQWNTLQISDQSWQLPPANPFIQETLKARELDRSQPKPRLLVKRPGLKMWHGQSKSFHQPKGHLYIASDSPLVDAQPEHRAWTKLYVDMLYDELSEITYQAETAGIGYELFSHSTGVSLHLGGFTGRQSFLLELIFEQFRNPKLSKSRFIEIQSQLLRNIKNQANTGPLNRLFATLSNLVQPASLTPEKMAYHIENTSHDDILEFSSTWRKTIALEVLAYGDYTEWEARSLADQMSSQVFREGVPYNTPAKQIASIAGFGQLNHRIDNQHQDSALVIYYQSQHATPYRTALYALTNQLMSATFFNELRTRQQFGYSVGTGYMPLASYPGLLFYVQSNVAGPTAIIDAIDDFIQQFPLVLLELNEESWQQTKQSLMAQIMDKDRSLQEKSKRFWVSIGNGDLKFDQRERIIEELKQISRADVLKFIVTQLRPKNADRVVLSALGSSHNHIEEDDLLDDIGSIESFQERATRLSRQVI